MVDFNFYNPTQIIFGKGRETEAGSIVSGYGKKILLHYGGGSIKRSGLYGRVVESLRAAGIAFVELGGVRPNPRLSLVREGIELCKAQGVDFILAVGGGSVIDSAKAIAGGVLYDGDIWDIYIGKGDLPAALPLGAILTIPAAGSESSPDSVITNENGMLKRGATSPAYFPRFAIINPELYYTLPPYQTACGCCDIIAHMLERYFTPTKEVDVSDRLIEAGLQTMLHYAPIALEQPENYDARAQISWIGTVCHNRLFNAGRVGDWASHDIEHELSAEYDIPHGAGLAIVFPAWMKYTYKTDMDRFHQFAVRVMGVDFAYAEKETAILEAVRRLEAFFKRLGLPVRLKDAGIDNTKLEAMSQRAMLYRDHIGAFQQLRAKDIQKIYELAYE
ncbi:MAG: iron-containing alcohol dehydrogenase [Clostridia bacterium]|nr:iron-containing alcohol dehydrogenase [Clostridia bacterium]